MDKYTVYVVIAYAVTFGVLALYLISLYLRLRRERERE